MRRHVYWVSIALAILPFAGAAAGCRGFNARPKGPGQTPLSKSFNERVKKDPFPTAIPRELAGG